MFEKVRSIQQNRFQTCQPKTSRSLTEVADSNCPVNLRHRFAGECSVLAEAIVKIDNNDKNERNKYTHDETCVSFAI